MYRATARLASSPVARLAAACLAATPVSAQVAPSTPASAPPAPAAPAATSATIVVTGRRLPAKKEVEHLTHAITPTVDASQPLARFPDAVCPASEGMPLDYDARLAARMRDDATAAGIPVDKPGCRPNVIVMVVPSGQAVVRELRRTRGYMFGQMEPHEISAMVNDAGPVHGWTVTQIRSRDGDTERAGTMMQDVPELQVREASIIESATRQDINASVLLIDVDAVIGKTVNQIADYAAMRTLGHTRPAAGGDTIMTLFAPGDSADRPRELTGFDTAYLKALYHGPSTTRAMLKMNQIARAINAAPGEHAGKGHADAAR